MTEVPGGAYDRTVLFGEHRAVLPEIGTVFAVHKLGYGDHKQRKNLTWLRTNVEECMAIGGADWGDGIDRSRFARTVPRCTSRNAMHVDYDHAPASRRRAPMNQRPADFVTLRDNRTVLVRPVADDDAPLLAQLFLRLSEMSRFRRFLGPRKHFSLRELTAYTNIDHRQHEAIAALAFPSADLVGIAQFWRDERDDTVAEVALTVADEFQGVGLGTVLLDRLVGRARSEGIRRFRAYIHESNRRVLNMGRRVGPRVAMAYRSPGAIEAEFDLSGDRLMGCHTRADAGSAEAPTSTRTNPDTTSTPPSLVGFIGLGVMGEPMALNLVRTGTPLLVWNRTPARTQSLAAAGASVAATVSDVFARAEVVILMLADEAAIDAVLDHHGPDFTSRVQGCTVVHMGTTSPSYSQALEQDIRAAGGRYVEAPVSGSRVPAQNGQLVALLAGEENAVDIARPLLTPMCRATLMCGPVPNGLLMKLAVNVFLITQVTGLAESFHFASQHGLDLSTLATALNGGQMASDISRVKVAKLLEGNFEVQAAIADVLKNNRLIVDAAREVGLASPLIDVCHALFAETFELGLGRADMVAVLRAIEARDDRR